MITIEYILGENGWATANIGNGNIIQQMNVSYLHDTLKQLAESALFIKDQKGKRIIFMDEPGEHHLIIYRLSEKEIEYELRWYDTWANWNATQDEKFTLILSEKTTITNYINEVRNVLINIWENYGVESYKEKWINHQYPTSEFEKLK
ncbi:hypothetical protein JBL43_19660 [Aureibaculum sp. A20]|uniref:Uncharacterized protein n=1 Tax=Aureibaculum flavum TaxID=2795986 RepID=A0ABS0WWV1_9FLAO|nr:hypothetical protein [Aureibaculum flavum]MBJ2176477.1 hypothetical protein [Aureibaculum flavum]